MPIATGWRKVLKVLRWGKEGEIYLMGFLLVI
jgi:hypothetical protein